jgi:acyl-coenzyme A synthetase/AMP-(fatty) acid ligase
MKRAVLCVPNPQDYLSQLDNYSVMVINPDSTLSRKKYLLDHSDWSLLIESDKTQQRNGADYANEKLLWYTSGTVGDSKFYSFSQQQLDQLCDSIIHDLAITSNDRYVGVMGLWHAHGQSLYWATRRAGCETHFLSTQEIKKIIKYQPTFLSAIPDILKVILKIDLKNLRFLRSGSAPLSVDLYGALKHKFNIPVIEYFGMTEAMSHVLSNPLEGVCKPGMVGVPTLGVQAEIRDAHLWICSKQGYTTDWFDTGDLAEQDSDGYFKIIGRRVDRINIKGYKIDPASLEKQIKQQLPNLEQIAIFGQHSVNCLYTGDVGADQVIQVMKNIHSVCTPKWIAQVQQIPLSPSGKVSRTYLSRIFSK